MDLDYNSRLNPVISGPVEGPLPLTPAIHFIGKRSGL
jgi:hypothetical protein